MNMDAALGKLKEKGTLKGKDKDGWEHTAIFKGDAIEIHSFSEGGAAGGIGLIDFATFKKNYTDVRWR